MAIKLYIDVPDRTPGDPGWCYEGLLKDRIGDYTISRSDCNSDGLYSDDAFICPVTGTIMPMPKQLTPQYYTTFTGDFSRLRLSNFSNTTGWTEVNYLNLGSGDNKNWFFLADSVGRLMTSGTFPANQPFWFAFCPFGRKGTNAVAANLSWSGLTVKIYGEGTLEVYKNGSLSGCGRITEGRKSIVGQMVYLIIVPYRRNSILFWSNQGGAYVYEDSSLPIDDADNWNITSAGQVTISFPETKGFFQFVPLKCKTSFNLELAKAVQLDFAPQVGSMVTSKEWDTVSGWGLSILIDPTPDGTETDFTWTISGQGDTADRFPFIYRVGIEFKHSVQDRYDQSMELTDNVKSLRREITEDAFQRSLTFELNNPDTISEVDKLHNRSVLLKDGDDEIFRGVISYIDKQERLTNSIRITVQDMWKKFSRARIYKEKAFDGMTHPDVIKYIARKVLGIAYDASEDSNYLDCNTDTALLPSARRDEHPLLVPYDGQRTADFIEYITDNFSQWDIEFRPVGSPKVYKLSYKNPSLYPSTPVRTFYDNSSDALLHKSDNGGETLVWRGDAAFDTIEPECNELWVVGQDCLGNPIHVFDKDSNSQNPETPPESRPDNWLGERRISVIIDSSINTSTDARAVLQKVFSEKKKSRKIAKWEGQYSKSLWKGDVVTLQNSEVQPDGTRTDGNYRITAITTEFVCIKPEEEIVQSIYWGEKI